LSNDDRIEDSPPRPSRSTTALVSPRPWAVRRRITTDYHSRVWTPVTRPSDRCASGHSEPLGHRRASKAFRPVQVTNRRPWTARYGRSSTAID